MTFRQGDTVRIKTPKGFADAVVVRVTRAGALRLSDGQLFKRDPDTGDFRGPWRKGAMGIEYRETIIGHGEPA